MDPETYREEARLRWEQASAGWEARREAFQAGVQPVSMWMVDHVNPQPGDTVLELAAGPGDTGLLAAELVAPTGRVLVTDVADGMVAAALRRAEALGLRNVEGRVMPAEWLDLPTASVDGVLCRYGYMLLVDPAAALRETRRVLRRGGRMALAAWAAPEHNPWMTGVFGPVAELGLSEPPDPDEPGPFTFAAPGRIEELLDEAGFEDAAVEPLDLVFSFASTDEHFEHQRALSPRLTELVASLSPADHTRLRDAIDERLAPYVGPDGSVRLPGRTWVAAAAA